MPANSSNASPRERIRVAELGVLQKAEIDY
jgi:hypothetical protein